MTTHAADRDPTWSLVLRWSIVVAAAGGERSLLAGWVGGATRLALLLTVGHASLHAAITFALAEGAVPAVDVG